jgi:PAS domain S-box-containing protein
MKKAPGPATEFSELRRRAEKQQRDNNSPAAFLSTDTDIPRLIHELQVHQIELEMQNEELQQTRARVEILLESYTDLYDFAPLGYFTLLKDGTIRKANLNGALMLGVDQADLEGSRLGLFVAEDHKLAFFDFLKRVFENQIKESCEVALPRKGSAPIWVRIEAIAAMDEQECRCMVMDITERKLAEKRLQEQFEELNRWHTITLGRETCILELKTEVNTLLAQMGQPPRYASVIEEDTGNAK